MFVWEYIARNFVQRTGVCCFRVLAQFPPKGTGNCQEHRRALQSIRQNEVTRTDWNRKALEGAGSVVSKLRGSGIVSPQTDKLNSLYVLVPLYVELYAPDGTTFPQTSSCILHSHRKLLKYLKYLKWYNFLNILLIYEGAHGNVVLKPLFYKSEDRWFETRCECNFSIYLIFPAAAALGPGVYSAINRNDHQKEKNNVSGN
jgi:hypothetical protein